jgi:pimeloyl-ACP methyl ester carboxylesterase
MKSPEEFQIRIAEAQLDDLRRRLVNTRWPDEETVDDWSQGIPLAFMRRIAAYWLDGYHWRQREALINRFPQFRAEVGGLGIHFIHLRSPHAGATPLLMTHGWPGSVLEFLKVIGPLADPESEGGRIEDAFHIVCPSLPGFGFSDKPARGYGVEQIAELWDELMVGLGYDNYIAQGGDWGGAVTTAIALQDRGHCKAIHLNVPVGPPPPEALENPTAADQRAFDIIKNFSSNETGYSKQQSTRPQTLGYGLADSPIAQAAWILEKFRAWTDCDGDPESILSRDELLDNVMIYWLTGSGTSSARLYWESFGKSFVDQRIVSLPMGCSLFPKELRQPPRSWAERQFPNLIYWNELPKGGHFAAFEQPLLFIEELRRFHRAVRARA